jgi:hypothetical protein
VITIDGERITYRNIDYMNNTVSGLRRGTAGTAADSHLAQDLVYDIGIGQILPIQYQDRIVREDIIADGTETVFTAPDLNLSYGSIEPYDSLPYDIGEVNGEPGSYAFGENQPKDFLQVYVGGILSTDWTLVSDAPVSIAFAVPPTAGYQVSIQVRQGFSWYQRGVFFPSNGVPLQETDTIAARFIRGQ